MLSSKILTWLRYCLLLISFIPLTSFVKAGKSSWNTQANNVDSFIELGRLKRQCFNRIKNENPHTISRKKCWQNRLIKLEALIHDTKRFTDAHLISEDLKEIWPKSFAGFTFNDLKPIEARCLRMLGYQEVLLTEGIWVERLREIKSLLKETKPRKFKRHKKQLEKLDNCPPYQIRYICINTHNPSTLDLHGVASAQIAQRKVIEFINAAKFKQKKRVLIITGRGNHSSYKNRQGVLFKAFPTWIKGNQNVSGYKVGKGNGCYIVTLASSVSCTPANLQILFQYEQRKLAHVKPLEQQIAWEKEQGESDLSYNQMYRELIHILHDARRLQELEIAYSRDDYLRPLTRILCKEEEGGILELEGEEII